MPFREMKDGKPTKRWVAKIVWNGEQLWLGFHPTQREAREAEELEKARRLLKDKKGYGIETCDTFAAQWTLSYPRPRETTNQHNAERVRKFALEFKGIPLVDVDRPTARAWAIRNPSALSAVRAMFSDALNDGSVASNPFTGLRVAKQSTRKGTIQVLTRAEVDSLAGAALKAHPGQYGQEMRSLILFAAYVGLRPGELMGLKVADLDLPLLRIERQRNKLGSLTAPKNGKARIVTVPPPAQQALRELPGRDGFLFLSKQGKPLTSGTLFYAWDAVRKTWGRPGMDLYELRHAAATILLEMGLSPADVAVQLGHTDGGALVMSTYGHPSDVLARERILAAFDEVDASKVIRFRKVGGE